MFSEQFAHPPTGVTCVDALNSSQDRALLAKDCMTAKMLHCSKLPMSKPPCPCRFS